MGLKANVRLRSSRYGHIQEGLGCLLVFFVLSMMVVGLGSMARNRLPFDTPDWERQLVFWVVGLSPIVGAISAGLMSLALHIRRETFRRGNRVQVIRGPHEGCLGIVRGTREGFKVGGPVPDTHVSVRFEENGEVLTEEFYIGELVKADFRSRWF